MPALPLTAPAPQMAARLRRIGGWTLAGGIVLAQLLDALVLATPAKADPPSWAPAHGHHKKKGKHKGGDDVIVVLPRPEVRYVQPRVAYVQPRPARAVPYGIDRGTCERSLIDGRTVGQVLGGLAGAAAGTQIGSGSGQTAATIGGAVLGLLIGGELGSQIAPADQACIASALDHAPDRRAVAWRDPDQDVAYRVVPTRSYESAGRTCRDYHVEIGVDGRPESATGTACRQGDGTWRIVN
ncbi:MAG TPA: hypothetical protein VEH84_07470 [Alphaproteobacteria bacterium]|nr:hypothetical protein [Alphaproteobacteria bacterium]